MEPNRVQIWKFADQTIELIGAQTIRKYQRTVMVDGWLERAERGRMDVILQIKQRIHNRTTGRVGHGRMKRIGLAGDQQSALTCKLTEDQQSPSTTDSQDRHSLIDGQKRENFLKTIVVDLVHRDWLSNKSVACLPFCDR